jgi:hypothetical protein
MDPTVPDRGLKRQSFFVLRETSCPAVLIEIGFLSNASELLKMLEPEWMDYCADAIADGILDYAEKKDALDVAVREKREREFAWKKAKEEKAKAALAIATGTIAASPPAPATNAVTLIAALATPLPRAAPLPKPLLVEPVKTNIQKTVIEAKPADKIQPAATNASPPSIFDFYSKK